MATVLVSGVGALGTYAVELLARSPEVDRIITLKRSPWNGPSRVNLAMIGAVFQGHAKPWRHHQVDLADTTAVATLLAAERPDVILHSATVQSPRRLMRASIADGIRELLRSATFSLWLPWHLMPAAHLTMAIEVAAIDTAVVNASFPDVVNPTIHARFGHGPEAGAGNVEVAAAQIVRYMADVESIPPERVELFLVGSHAFLSRGPEVPHHLTLRVDGEDVTDRYDLAAMLSWPERIAWNRVDEFSLFAASAVKNTLALLGDDEVHTHVSGAEGLPGGYPARVAGGRVRLDLPEGIDRSQAVAINELAATWDGIEHIHDDGTVLYTERARDAMARLGYPYETVEFDQLEAQCEALSALYERITTMEGIHA